MRGGCAANGSAIPGAPHDPQYDAMDLKHLARAGFAALTAPKLGPSLYDLCDPVLGGDGPGDAHLRKFYKTAVANPLLRPVLARAGLPQLADEARFRAL